MLIQTEINLWTFWGFLHSKESWESQRGQRNHREKPRRVVIGKKRCRGQKDHRGEGERRRAWKAVPEMEEEENGGAEVAWREPRRPEQSQQRSWGQREHYENRAKWRDYRGAISIEEEGKKRALQKGSTSDSDCFTERTARPFIWIVILWNLEKIFLSLPFLSFLLPSPCPISSKKLVREERKEGIWVLPLVVLQFDYQYVTQDLRCNAMRGLKDETDLKQNISDLSSCGKLPILLPSENSR